jgi:hypothetical protein
VSKMNDEWIIYRTRFLVKARQLTEPLTFVDVLGREHSGLPGDYLVESSDGMRRIAPREIFEDIYVPMGTARSEACSLSRRNATLRPFDRRAIPRRAITA